MTVCVCVWHSSGAFPSCQWKTLVSCPHKPTHHPPASFPPLFNSVHQHFLLQPVSVTLHFLSSLNQSDSPQSARFWVSLKRQRASKSITAFLIFIDPKTRLPPRVCPNATRPRISLRGINYSKEGDCAEVWKWCCLADCTCNSFNKVFKNVRPQHLRRSLIWFSDWRGARL